jgi:Tfp pilus assembly protein PilF
MSAKPGRNDPCTCGSGRRYKQCCGQIESPRPFAPSTPRVAEFPEPPGPPASGLPSPEQLQQLLGLLNAQRYAELERSALELTVRYPHSGLAWKALSAALLLQHKDALAALTRATELLPEDAEAHGNLAGALLALGRLDGAVTSYRRALEIKSDYTNAHINLGNALLSLGRPDEAIGSYGRALEIQPDYAEVHNNLGNALRSLGRTEAAIRSYRRALVLSPNYIEAYGNLGNALQDFGRLEDAIASYRKALEIAPDLPEAHNNLGNARLELGDIEEALASYRRALASRPHYAEAHSNLGIALRLQGKTAAAEESCRRALELNPKLAMAWVVLADAQADQGQFVQAEEFFRRAIAVEPNLPEAWAGIAHLRKLTQSDAPWLSEVLRLTDKTLPARKEILLRYALGKYFDDTKDFDQAFHHFRGANELAKSLQPRYDRRRSTLAVDRLIQTFSRQWIERAAMRGAASARPVFIVGMPRSGTSLAEQILSTHAMVFGAGELSFWTDAALAHQSLLNSGEIYGDDLPARAASYLQLLETLSSDALHVVDKMPTNFLHLGLIHATLPNARIIHMQRNPIDTCLSIYFQDFKATLSYANDLDDLAHYYAQYRRLMRHWELNLPANSILRVPYEGLVEDQEAWSRRLFEFIALPWDPRCLDFHQTRRTVVTASKWQVRQKLSATSVARWRNYEKHVLPLRELLEAT